jgi:hypothetical protein
MIKELLLQKGWAGKTISRSDTVELLNPIIKQHLVLNNDYGFVIARHPDSRVGESLASTQKVARANVGKLAETVYSCGGVAYTGVDLEPTAVNLGDKPSAMLDALVDGETRLVEAIEAQEEIEHQMRTRAILGVVAASARERLAVLDNLLRNSR